ncbi:uncharacterized protein PHACADRAFT_255854 [Phanerochaete carnosa HHB-10118-sp]|uniref:Replication protein A subunit n=1 Tax=Phanerochaete carnosa (strain HHB-10118-sp) TaxID=650164 RepID=K5W851_PHACS|nr:uncharacterized protein PHACADRAFT_255854 [Phanerochaete carnosa HHB-10118-sp]EKM55320.1 hypothetical protein PHACADRAFT_255854 [Phanerochaete carnosa HHB-10118-sp]
MLATPLNELVENGQLTKNSIVVADEFSCNYVGENKGRLLIILRLTPLASPNEKIGSPTAIQGAVGSNGKPISSAGGTPTPASAPKAAPKAAPQPAPAMHNNASNQQRHTFPIEGLSPYQNNWTIRVKVTQKSDIRQYSNARGDGKLFSAVLMDDTGEIKATAFNNNVDEFYPKLEEGKIYYISKGQVSLAKKKFNNVNNEYELGLQRGTIIEECRDGPVLNIHYKFIPLDQLMNTNPGDTIDVLGIVKEMSDVTHLTSRQGNDLTKRELTIVDRSGASVRLTLWGKQADRYCESGEPIIAWKSVKVGDFGGRSLSMLSSSSMEINPDIPDAHVLRGWYDTDGKVQDFQPQTSSAPRGSGGAFNRDEIRLLDDVRSANLGGGDKPDFFSAHATIMHIKSDNIAYPACQNQGCNKKVIEQHDGWRCEKCDKVFERPSYRYIMAMAVADHSGQVWFQCFNEAGVVIFDMTADQLVELKDRDDAQYNKVLESAVGTTYNFTCRAKMESFQENNRVRYGVQKILPLDYKEEGNYLMKLLSSPWAQ